jgi:hypothetical protein
MQNAASTASPARYPSRLIADIAVGMILCVNVIPRSYARYKFDLLILDVPKSGSAKPA